MTLVDKAERDAALAERDAARAEVARLRAAVEGVLPDSEGIRVEHELTDDCGCSFTDYLDLSLRTRLAQTSLLDGGAA